jgi:hypothetical protein
MNAGMPEAQPRWALPGSGSITHAALALWETTPDAMVLTDSDGTVRAANPAYCVRHQSTPQLLIGGSVAITLPAAERGVAMAHYRAVFASRAKLNAYPTASHWRDDPEHVTESRIAFATQGDGESFMLSSVRVICQRPTGPSPFASSGYAAEDLIINAVREWGVGVFGPKRPSSFEGSRKLFETQAEDSERAGRLTPNQIQEPACGLDRWDDDGGAR